MVAACGQGWPDVNPAQLAAAHGLRYTAAMKQNKPLAVPASIDATLALLNAGDYVADRSLATVLFLALKMGRPLFLEGEAGVGKTEIAKVLSATLGRRLIRLQCYEGLDVSAAVYEWNYAAQMIAIRLAEAEGAADRERLEHDVFSERFLIKRPLLQALEPDAAGRAGAADRRTRPHRRGVRGLPARSAGRLSGHHPGTRHGEGGASADRDHHIEPHARNPRRAQAALPLSLGRLSRRRARTCRSCAPRCRASPRNCRRRSSLFVQRAAQGRSVQVARRRRDARLGRGLVGTRCRRARSGDRVRHARRAAEIPGRHRPPRRRQGRGTARRRARGA